MNEAKSPRVFEEGGEKWIIEPSGRKRRFLPSDSIALDFLTAQGAVDRPLYVSKFLEKDFVARFRHSAKWRSLFNHRGIKKEITEAVAVYRQAKRLVADLAKGDWGRVVTFDIGSGKGFLGTLIALENPKASVKMVDNNRKIKLEHLEDVPNAQFACIDILKGRHPTIREFIDHTMAVSPGRDIAILLGIHLCGPLSESFLALFNEIESVRGLVLSPCCLTSAKRDDCAIRARKLMSRIDQYQYWSTHLFFGLPRGIRKTMIRDENMLSEKNALIIASKQPRVVHDSGFPDAASSSSETMAGSR